MASWEWITSNISILIACLALLISFVSITLSLLGYRKDRWKLYLQAWIEGPASPSTTNIRRWLFVSAKNIGRRVLTIENIFVQVFEDELEELRKIQVVALTSIQGIGSVAYFPPSGVRFPTQLGENEPVTAEVPLLGLHSLSRSRLCIVNVTGRRRLIKIPIGGNRRRKAHYFSGS